MNLVVLCFSISSCFIFSCSCNATISMSKTTSLIRHFVMLCWPFPIAIPSGDTPGQVYILVCDNRHRSVVTYSYIGLCVVGRTNHPGLWQSDDNILTTSHESRTPRKTWHMQHMLQKWNRNDFFCTTLKITVLHTIEIYLRLQRIQCVVDTNHFDVWYIIKFEHLSKSRHEKFDGHLCIIIHRTTTTTLSNFTRTVWIQPHPPPPH